MSTLLTPLPNPFSIIANFQSTTIKDRLPSFRSTILDTEQRNSYRIEANLAAQIGWNDPSPSKSYFQRPGVITNLMGSSGRESGRSLFAAPPKTSSRIGLSND